MANKEHLRILKQGVTAWNQWRKDHPLSFYEIIDLAGADLSGARLAGADLSGARLFATDLTGADLSEANLAGANLAIANLTGADLTGAHLGLTILGDTDLTNAKGLDSCTYLGYSILDHQTLTKSGRLPLSFLRGCGLPDFFIDHIPSLFLDNPIEFYSCFISYSTADSDFAERLHADLQNKGVRCWFAPEDMKIGGRLRQRIDGVIRLHDKLLLVLSKNSIASQWVEQEVETALALERKQNRTILFPVRVDNTIMKIEEGWPALIRNTRNIGNFTRWKIHNTYQKAFTRLLRDLKPEDATNPS